MRLQLRTFSVSVALVLSLLSRPEIAFGQAADSTQPRSLPSAVVPDSVALAYADSLSSTAARRRS